MAIMMGLAGEDVVVLRFELVGLGRVEASVVLIRHDASFT